MLASKRANSSSLTRSLYPADYVRDRFRVSLEHAVSASTSMRHRILLAASWGQVCPAVQSGQIPKAWADPALCREPSLHRLTFAFLGFGTVQTEATAGGTRMALSTESRSCTWPEKGPGRVKPSPCDTRILAWGTNSGRK